MQFKSPKKSSDASDPAGMDCARRRLEPRSLVQLDFASKPIPSTRPVFRGALAVTGNMCVGHDAVLAMIRSRARWVPTSCEANEPDAEGYEYVETDVLLVCSFCKESAENEIRFFRSGSFSWASWPTGLTLLFMLFQMSWVIDLSCYSFAAADNRFVVFCEVSCVIKCDVFFMTADSDL